MSKYFIIVFFAFAKAVFPQQASTQDQVSMSYYMPSEVTYNPDISTPEDVLGYIPENGM